MDKIIKHGKPQNVNRVFNSYQSELFDRINFLLTNTVRFNSKLNIPTKFHDMIPFKVSKKWFYTYIEKLPPNSISLVDDIFYYNDETIYLKFPILYPSKSLYVGFLIYPLEKFNEYFKVFFDFDYRLEKEQVEISSYLQNKELYIKDSLFHDTFKVNLNEGIKFIPNSLQFPVLQLNGYKLIPQVCDTINNFGYSIVDDSLIQIFEIKEQMNKFGNYFSSKVVIDSHYDDINKLVQYFIPITQLIFVYDDTKESQISESVKLIQEQIKEKLKIFKREPIHMFLLTDYVNSRKYRIRDVGQKWTFSDLGNLSYQYSKIQQSVQPLDKKVEQNFHTVDLYVSSTVQRRERGQMCWILQDGNPLTEILQISGFSPVDLNLYTKSKKKRYHIVDVKVQTKSEKVKQYILTPVTPQDLSDSDFLEQYHQFLENSKEIIQNILPLSYLVQTNPRLGVIDLDDLIIQVIDNYSTTVGPNNYTEQRNIPGSQVGNVPNTYGNVPSFYGNIPGGNIPSSLGNIPGSYGNIPGSQGGNIPGSEEGIPSDELFDLYLYGDMTQLQDNISGYDTTTQRNNQGVFSPDSLRILIFSDFVVVGDKVLPRNDSYYLNIPFEQKVLLNGDLFDLTHSDSNNDQISNKQLVSFFKDGKPQILLKKEPIEKSNGIPSVLCNIYIENIKLGNVEELSMTKEEQKEFFKSLITPDLVNEQQSVCDIMENLNSLQVSNDEINEILVTPVEDPVLLNLITELVLDEVFSDFPQQSYKTISSELQTLMKSDVPRRILNNLERLGVPRSKTLNHLTKNLQLMKKTMRIQNETGLNLGSNSIDQVKVVVSKVGCK